MGEGFLEIHSVSHGPLGDVHGVRMLEYNAADKVFTLNMYNSLGEHQLGPARPGRDLGVEFCREVERM